MIRAIALVFVGGAVGAVIRELLMMGVPTARDGFVWSIFVGNVVAAFVLGLVNGLNTRQAIQADTNLFLGTGLTGGLSTFSSLAYATFVLLSTSELRASVGVVYASANLVVGFVLVMAGLKIGESLGAKNNRA
jgi:CrcB protein